MNSKVPNNAAIRRVPAISSSKQAASLMPICVKIAKYFLKILSGSIPRSVFLQTCYFGNLTYLQAREVLHRLDVMVITLLVARSKRDY